MNPRKLVLLVFVAVIVVLAIWGKTYRQYDNAQREAARQYIGNDFQGALETLERYESEYWSYPILRSGVFKRLSDRHVYRKGTALVKLGEFERAALYYKNLETSSDAVVASYALYDKAILVLISNDRKAAIEQYRAALMLEPTDIQTKINLELLLKKQKQEQQQQKKDGDKDAGDGDGKKDGNKDADKGDGKKGKGKTKSPSSMDDYWLYVDADDDSPSVESDNKRIWK